MDGAADPRTARLRGRVPRGARPGRIDFRAPPPKEHEHDPEAGPEWGGSFTLTRRPEYRTVRDLCRKWALNEDCWPAEGCDVEVHWTLERKRSGRIVDEGDNIICVPPYHWDVLVTFRRGRRWVDLRWQYHDFPRPTEREIVCDFARRIKEFGRFRGRVRWVAENNREIPDVDGSFLWDAAAERLYAAG